MQSIIEIILVTSIPLIVVTYGSIVSGFGLMVLAHLLLHISKAKYGIFNIPMSELRQGENL